MKDFFSKNKNLIGMILAVIFTIMGVKVPVGNEIGDSQAIIQEGIAEALTPIIREVVREELKSFKLDVNKNFDDVNNRFDELVMQSYTIDIDELVLALAEIRTPEGVDALVQYWVDEGWTKKLTAIQRISEFKKARDALAERLYSEEVFKTLMTYSK
ncbi:MAG: hypothetical protein WBA74_10250 [Cyclobacteriaceae bacterium]